MANQQQSDAPACKVISLVSIGRHPLSGRVRRADQDARGVALGLQWASADLTLLHAGDPEEQVLRQYAGMGVKQLVVLRQDPEDDALPALTDYIQQQSCAMVLAGMRAESGESSGMLPYLLAERLSWPIVSGVAEIVAIEQDQVKLLLALPRGQRRAVTVKLPFIATISGSAPEPGQSAFGVGLRANIAALEVPTCVDDERSHWQVLTAKPRAKRLQVVKAKTAAERMKAATAKAQAKGGSVLISETVEEKAQAIFDLLIEEKVIR